MEAINTRADLHAKLLEKTEQDLVNLRIRNLLEPIINDIYDEQLRMVALAVEHHRLSCHAMNCTMLVEQLFSRTNAMRTSLFVENPYFLAELSTFAPKALDAASKRLNSTLCIPAIDPYDVRVYGILKAVGSFNADRTVFVKPMISGKKLFLFNK
jgi:hypothetical protein